MGGNYYERDGMRWNGGALGVSRKHPKVLGEKWAQGNAQFVNGLVEIGVYHMSLVSPEPSNSMKVDEDKNSGEPDK